MSQENSDLDISDVENNLNQNLENLNNDENAENNGEEQKQDGEQNENENGEGDENKPDPKVKKPRGKPFRFQPQMLMDKKKGLKFLYEKSQKKKFGDPNSGQFKEVEALGKLLTLNKEWHDYFMPRYDYKFFLHKCQQFGDMKNLKSEHKVMQSYLQRVRRVHKGEMQWDELDDPNFVQEENKDIDNNNAGQGQIIQGDSTNNNNNQTGVNISQDMQNMSIQYTNNNNNTNNQLQSQQIMSSKKKQSFLPQNLKLRNNNNTTTTSNNINNTNNSFINNLNNNSSIGLNNMSLNQNNSNNNNSQIQQQQNKNNNNNNMLEEYEELQEEEQELYEEMEDIGGDDDMMAQMMQEQQELEQEANRMEEEEKKNFRNQLQQKEDIKNSMPNMNPSNDKNQ